MSVRIEVSGSPQDLAELEDLCRVARLQGFPDQAWLDLSSGRRVVVKTESDQVTL